MAPFALTPTMEQTEGILNGDARALDNGETNGHVHAESMGGAVNHPVEYEAPIVEQSAPAAHSFGGPTEVSNGNGLHGNEPNCERTNGNRVNGNGVNGNGVNGNGVNGNGVDGSGVDGNGFESFHEISAGDSERPTSNPVVQLEPIISNGTNTTPVSDSPDSYEVAYTDGYKSGYSEGYTASHIELKHQPIAIIGMACRFPGDVSTPDEFWELLARSRTGFSEIPKERFSSERFFHPNPGKSGTTNARGGNFLQCDLTAFDAPFFNFTAQEATSLDPQQRLLLECTFEALESAGIPKHSVVGKDVGCFVGGSFSEYEADLFRDPDTIPMHQATGCAMAMQSNRISHFFDLRGPSFTVDTACSSSLVALHTACQSIRSNESGMAIVGGVHLNMLPEFWISFSQSRLFGEDGRSYAFDQRGTGYGRGEGCGLLILKPMDQAIKDNDPIRAVITGSGINQDGKTPGITMPNGSAQEALIRSVYKNGGMNPADTGYVEAHGTGTRVGDPIEVTALHNVFGEGRTKRTPLFVGSVKSNIGHLEAAAGLAGIIKTALMLERGFILPNYDFKQPNEKIPFDKWGLKVPVNQRPWPLGKRWASVNGFGFGGTNAHVVMTKGPLERKTMKEEIDTQVQNKLFMLSANDKVGTERLMRNLGVYLEQRPEVFELDLLNNLAYTLGQRKSLLPWRLAITASTSVELVEILSSGKVFPAKQDAEAIRIGFIFTGQGAQWWAMGRELYERYPIYAVALDKADAHLRSLGAPFSLLEELSKDEETTQINAASMSQPSCTAVQLALTDLLRSWGIQPTAVAGHSSGEIGAAYAAGFITFEDAMTVAYHRGRLIPVLKKKFPALDGCMMAVGAGKDEIVPLLERIPTSIGEARIACINSPSSVTVSGDANAILELQRIIEEVYPGMFARKLQVDTAYHSHHMGGISKEYTQALLSLEAPKPSDVRFHSSLLGRLADSSELDATYWVQNLTCAVRFDEAVQSMCQPVDDFRTGVNFLLELGPHAALQGPIKQILKAVGGPAAKIAYSSALARKKNAVKTAFALTGTLFVKGATLEMGAINFPKPLERAPVVLTDMPRYPWNHQTKFHSQSRFTDIHKFQKEKRSDIIGVLAPYSNELEPTWRNIVRLDDLPWLRHHQIQDLTLFPISGFVVMALEAAAQRASWKNAVYDTLQVRDVNVTNPLMIPEDELEMTITLQPSNDFSSVISDGFKIRSWSKSKGWTEHCTGIVSTEQADTNEVDGIRSQQAREQRFKDKISKIIRSATTSMTAGSLYERLSDVGVSYGECFQGLQNCQASDLAAVAHITVADTATDMPHHEESRYVLHPTLLEQLIEMYWPTLSAKTGLNTVYLPSSIGKVTVSTKLWTIINKPGERLEAFCQPRSPLVELKPNTLSMFAVESQDATEALIEVDNLVISPLVEPSVDIETNAPRELCYKEIWEPVLHSSEIENGMSQSQFDVEIVIVHGDTSLQQGLATNVASLLAEMTGSNPSMGLLSSINAKDKICIFLTEIDQPVLANLDSAEFDVLQKLLTSVHSMLWVVQGAYADSKNPDANMIAGLSRTLRSEGTLMDFVTLDLDAEQLSAENTAKTIVDVLRSSLSSSRTSSETEFMERAGLLQTPRIVNDIDMNAYVHEQIEPPATEPTKFTSVERPLRGIIATPGALDTLRFEDDRIFETPLPKDEVEIQVKAIGLSPHDVHVAVGHNAGNDAIGMECSGIITAIGSGVSSVAIGDRVAAITTRGSLSTVTRARDPFLFKLPDHLSFTMAATIPIAFSTAYYGLVELASISEDESVLIQDAATAAGQAAIVVAQMIGAEVFTTVRNAEEKMTLRDQYNVAEEKIYFTGSESFIDAILEATTNAGVDVIFNAQSSGEILRTSWSCLAKFGRFIDASTNITHTVEYVPIEKNQIAACVDIASMALERPRKMQRILTDVARLLRYGKLRSSHPIHAHGVSESTTALQALQSENVHGKVVIVPREDETILAPRTNRKSELLRTDATYILIGGTGGLGRSMAKWMIGNGAKNIVLLSRSGTVKGKAKDQIDSLNSAGANIVLRSCDVADRGDVEKLLSTELEGLPPVRGVIHGAMVLHDVLFEKMTYAQYTSVIESKVKGAWNFHRVLEDTPLDFFVVISSAAGAVGNRGQAAYAAANTFLNGFTQYRVRQGLPAASIDLTAVSDAGYLAEDAEKAAEVARNLGSDTICEAEVLALIGAAISGKMASTCNHHSITGMRITATMRPFWSEDAKFVHLLKVAEEAAKELSVGKTVAISWSAAIKAATTREEAEYVVCNGLVEKIAEVISVEKEELDVTRALSHYPLDSLTAIEVRNFITRMFESNLQVLELLASGSIQTLARLVCAKSKIALPVA